MDTPSSKTEKWSRVAGKANKVIAVVAILVLAMVYFGQKIMMGKKFKFSDKESVNYSGTVTEDEAKRLGDVLKAVGYFTGSKDLDVLFKKDEKEGTVVSFVLNSKWSDDEIVGVFRQIGAAIISQGLGKPLTVRLLDDHLNTKNEFKIE
jgi:hypothetical protein